MSEIKTEHGTLADVFEGDRFRFVDGDEWFTVYGTRGCLCGGEDCRPEREVAYYAGEWPGREDKYGNAPSRCECFCWDWFEEPPEVEWIKRDPLTEKQKRAAADRQIAAWLANKETAECESADPTSNPSANEGRDA